MKQNYFKYVLTIKPLEGSLMFNLFGGKKVDPREQRIEAVMNQFNFTKFNRKAFMPYLKNLLNHIDESEKIERIMYGFDSLTAATAKQVVTADKKIVEAFPYDKITGVEAGVMTFQLHTKGGTVNIKSHNVNMGKAEMVAFIRGKIM
jgi:hypothetical protein